MSAMQILRHVPVLTEPVLKALAPSDGEVIVDGTYGGGAHAQAILDAANVTVLAIDRDPDAQARAQTQAKTQSRLVFSRGCFSSLDTIAALQGFAAVDAVLLDIGVSSFQLDEAQRGFSFMSDGPLDMRMESQGVSAADAVNHLSEQELITLFRYLGEEPAARRLAVAIVKQRHATPFRTTAELAGLAVQVLGPGKKRHPATRLFQALRIFINNELDELSGALSAAERLLKPGGRLVVVSFHSLEDRIVKTFFRTRAGLSPGASRHLPPAPNRAAPSLSLLQRRPVRPSEAELAENPRARSARMRWAVRTEAPVWDTGEDGILPGMPCLADLERLAA